MPYVVTCTHVHFEFFARGCAPDISTTRPPAEPSSPGGRGPGYARPSLRLHSVGLRSRLRYCLLACLLNRNSGKPKAEVAAPEDRRVPVAVPRAADPGADDPAAAPGHKAQGPSDQLTTV